MTTDLPTRFIGQPISVEFAEPPHLAKSPPCPSAFTHVETTYTIIANLDEWRDFRRRGRFAQNMRPEHAAAAQHGSWGVGRFYFRVRVHTHQTFDIYYDRSPKDIDHRAGSWHLYREVLNQP